jgi:transketolase
MNEGMACCNSSETIEYLQSKAKLVRMDCLQTIHAACSGHPGGALSAADIVTALYFNVMKIDPSRPDWPERDRFIMSKGHASALWYSCLAERGFFKVAELSTFRQINSRLQGHPDMRKTPGIDMTTGSLGQGLSIGVGMAIGAKMKKAGFRVFVLLGDGELDEGQVWEAALAASKYGLDNLIAVIDRNELQLDGTTEEIMPLEPLAAKWMAFGWNIVELDGNDMEQLIEGFKGAVAGCGKPTVIIAKTVKGRGVSFMEGNLSWHGRAPSDEELSQALCELEEK